MNDIMQQLIALAKQAANKGEVPIAAAIVNANGELISQRHNEVELQRDATRHAELLAIQEACEKLGEKYLTDCTLVVTLEPCAMCAQAIAHTKIKKLVFGAFDSKSGGVEHGARIFSQATCHHAPEVIGGILEKECSALLTSFFSLQRNK